MIVLIHGLAMSRMTNLSTAAEEEETIDSERVVIADY